MKRLLLMATAVLLLSSGACKRGYEPAYARVCALSENGKQELATSLKESQLVFKGTVLSVEDGWVGSTGSIVPSQQRVRFKIVKLLKGDPRANSLDVYYLITGQGKLLRRKKGAGVYQLDPCYFKESKLFVVGAFKPPKENYFVSTEGLTWEASQENLEDIEGLLRKP